MAEADLAAQPRRRWVQCASPKGLHRVAYLEWGDARSPDVLVCVHGLTRTGRDFDELARALCAGASPRRGAGGGGVWSGGGGRPRGPGAAGGRGGGGPPPSRRAAPRDV